LRFEKITLKNLMQYRDAEISLSRKRGKNDLHIVVGEASTGKTNLLRAIRWCLYSDEPQHSSLLNVNTAEASDDIKDRKVVVEIVARDGDQIFLFSRKAMFNVHRHAGYVNSVSTEQTESYGNVLALIRQRKKLTENRIRRETNVETC
jgi:DNA repair exonuclease SbcCD ATPase subunit